MIIDARVHLQMISQLFCQSLILSDCKILDETCIAISGYPFSDLMISANSLFGILFKILE